MRKYVLSAPGLTAAEEKLLAAKLTDPIGWWHHVPGVWLIADPEERLAPVDLVDYVGEIAPRISCIAVEVVPTKWATRLPPSLHPANSEWMANSWGVPAIEEEEPEKPT